MNKVKIVVCAVFTIVAMIVLGISIKVFLANRDNSKIEEGRAQMRDQYARQIDLNTRLRNDMALRISEGIERGVNDYTTRLQNEQAKRIADDRMTRDRIEELIAENPDYYTNRLCVVPDQMLAERNRIRHNVNLAN